MSTTCTRRLTFDAGHRVFGHENKCGHLHGHGYEAYITAQADDLDSVGRIVDFSVIKQIYNDWIQTYWDHGVILHEKDSNAYAAVRMCQPSDGSTQKIYTLPYNPTAENLAHYLGTNIYFVQALAQYGVKDVEVCVQETTNCTATWKLPGN